MIKSRIRFIEWFQLPTCCTSPMCEQSTKIWTRTVCISSIITYQRQQIQPSLPQQRQQHRATKTEKEEVEDGKRNLRASVNEKENTFSIIILYCYMLQSVHIIVCICMLCMYALVHVYAHCSTQTHKHSPYIHDHIQETCSIKMIIVYDLQNQNPL